VKAGLDCVDLQGAQREGDPPDCRSQGGPSWIRAGCGSHGQKEGCESGDNQELSKEGLLAAHQHQRNEENARKSGEEYHRPDLRPPCRQPHHPKDAANPQKKAPSKLGPWAFLVFEAHPPCSQKDGSRFIRQE